MLSHEICGIFHYTAIATRAKIQHFPTETERSQAWSTEGFWTPVTGTEPRVEASSFYYRRCLDLS